MSLRPYGRQSLALSEKVTEEFSMSLNVKQDGGDSVESIAEKSAMRQVINIKDSKGDVNEKYIGRGSKWGNPFKIGRDGNREEVIEKYREDLLQSDVLNDIEELRGKVLVCFCKPKACHGDILVELLEHLYNGCGWLKDE